MGIQESAQEWSSFPWLLLAAWRAGGASRSCYFVSIEKRMTPDLLPYNRMLINPLGPLWSGKLGSRYLRSLMAADLMRGSGGQGSLEGAGLTWSRRS